MSTFKYTINNKEYVVDILSVADDVAHLTVNGDEYTVLLEHEEKKEEQKVVLGTGASTPEESAPAVPTDSNNVVKAPLPGIVTEIKVAVGEKVAAGDTLLVLEAMKMANNISAEKEGVVKAVYVKVGESVMEEAPLVLVE